MIVGDRVRERMEALSISQAELARRVGVSQPTINNLINRSKKGSTHLHRIARELGTSSEYLVGETDDPAEGALPTPTPKIIAEQLDVVPITEIDLAYGLGGTYADGPVELQVHHFPRTWIESISSSPATQLTIARGRGDSMVPTIHDGDMIIFDRSQRTVREQDALWALTIGDVAMIKRVRVRGDTVSILSDNQSVPIDTAHAEEVNIVGRVIFVGRRT